LCCVGAGLHAYQLTVRRVSIDGAEASFQLQPTVVENLPEALLQRG